MERKKIEKIPWFGDEYRTMRAKVVELKTKVLLLDINGGHRYSMFYPRCRICVTKDDLQIFYPDKCGDRLVKGKWKRYQGRWHSYSLQSCFTNGYGTFNEKELPSADRASTDLVFEFTGVERENRRKYAHVWYNALCVMERNILDMKEERAIINWEKRMERRCNAVPEELPDGFEDWAQDFLWTYDSLHKKRVTGLCWRCGRESTVERTRLPKAGEKTVCPSCGKEVRIIRDKGQRKVERTYAVAALQKVESDHWTLKGSLVERHMLCHVVQSPGKSEMELTPSLNKFIKPDGSYHIDYYINDRGDFYWNDRSERMSGGCVQAQYGKLYTGNITREFFAETPWRYSAAEIFAVQKGIRNIGSYLVAYLREPGLEMLVKLGLIRFTREFVRAKLCRWYNWDIGKEGPPWTRLELTKEEYQYMRKYDAQFWEIEGIRWLGTFDRQLILDAGSIRNATAINEISLMHDLSLKQVINYVVRQAGRNSRYDTISIWEDYLDMAEEFGLPMDSPIVIRPKNLQESHDYVMDQLRIQKQEKERQEREAYFREMNKKYAAANAVLARISEMYSCRGDNYSIVVPKSVSEIEQDGEILQHCIGSNPDPYLNKIAHEETYILFLRKNDALDAPYGTIECEPGGGIRQLHFFRNTDMKEVQVQKLFGALLAGWKRHIADKMTEHDKALRTRSCALRYSEFQALRRNGNKIWRGQYEGQLLADVLERNYIETEVDEAVLKEAALIKSAFTVELTVPHVYGTSKTAEAMSA